MFLTSFNVCFMFGYAYFVCQCLQTAIWLFLGQDLAFFVEDRFGWQPWLLILNWCMTGLGVSYWKF